MKQKVALYCRLSNEDSSLAQGEESGSIQNQKLLLSDYAEKMGWEVYDVYCDDDLSGLREDRPAFLRLIADAKKGLFSIVLCKTQSRFTRSMETAERYLHHTFPKLGIRFVTVVDHVDTAEKANKKTRQLNSLINEWYCEELSENIKAVFRRKWEMGQYLGNYAPYGYQKSEADRHILAIDTQTAPVVRGIFRLAVLGFSQRQIASLLTLCAIATPSEVKRQRGEDLGRKQNLVWAASTVSTILHDPVYLGHMAQGKSAKAGFKETACVSLPKEQWVIVRHTHPPLVEASVFDAAQQALSGRNKRRAQMRSALTETPPRDTL